MLRCRWMLNMDAPAVLTIDKEWSWDDWRARLREEKCIARVVSDKYDTIKGAFLEEFHWDHLTVTRFLFTCPAALGVALDKLSARLSTHRRTRVLVNCSTGGFGTVFHSVLRAAGFCPLLSDLYTYHYSKVPRQEVEIWEGGGLIRVHHRGHNLLATVSDCPQSRAFQVSRTEWSPVLWDYAQDCGEVLECKEEQ